VVLPKTLMDEMSLEIDLDEEFHHKIMRPLIEEQNKAYGDNQPEQGALMGRSTASQPS